MRRAAARALGLAGLVALCSAHVGSPDVWYEGAAGPYHVVVYVRLPGVVPGIADINVQVVDATPEQVTALVNLYDANAGTPPPDVARPVRRSGWYATRLWIMAPGSNSVTISVKGAKGTGTTIVPVAAVPNRRLPLQRSLGDHPRRARPVPLRRHRDHHRRRRARGRAAARRAPQSPARRGRARRHGGERR